MVLILTQREREIISKKIKGLSLTQNESNILSKTIRPKLNEIREINADLLLNKLEYNQMAKSIENKVKKIILENIKGVKAIILCGSAVQTNYKEYNDIDIIIAINRVLNEKTMEKRKMVRRLLDIAEKEGLILDIQIYALESIINQYPSSPSLIYQLKDSKVIYGNIKIPNKIELSSLDLRMKLDWSDIENIYSEGKKIYQALRNTMLVLLLMNKKVDNYELKQSIINLFGENLILRLKKNKVSRAEKKIVLNYIKSMSDYLSEQLRINPKWEKIEISNH
ncbi:MAG: nucleotidyltransferase domain-containing protein [Nanoarchaeota archaeon]